MLRQDYVLAGRIWCNDSLVEFIVNIRNFHDIDLLFYEYVGVRLIASDMLASDMIASDMLAFDMLAFDMLAFDILEYI